jgi:putative mRNA 3-end processing factor
VDEERRSEQRERRAPQSAGEACGVCHADLRSGQKPDTSKWLATLAAHVTVRYRDGIEITLSTGERVVCDADEPDGDVNVVSHAHGDHLYERAPEAVVWSNLTRKLAAVRRDEVPATADDDRITLVDAGHVPGARAAVIEDPDGTTYCYTGDLSTREHRYLDGFEAPDGMDVDVLVIESTYGEPEYVFPPPAEATAAFREWVAETDAPVLVFAYSLGRAQEVQLILGGTDRQVHVTDAVAALNEPIADAYGLDFPVRRYGSDVELDAGDALVLPAQTNRLSFVEAIVEETGARKTALSGWAVDSSFRFAGGYDATFPLSDHCDFEELLAVVEAVDPEQVYTCHGSTDSLAREVRSRLGYEARALKRNQTSLGEF